MTDETHKCWTVSTTSHLRNLTREELKEATYAVHYQNPPRKNENGTTTLSMMFPALVVSFYASEPAMIATRVAEVLNAHWDGWRLIDTAPKDGWGAPILACRMGDPAPWFGHQAVGGYAEPPEATYWNEDGDCWTACHRPHDEWEPTHWMPFPEPPAVAQEGGSS